jgi:hypothetical protein
MTQKKKPNVEDIEAAMGRFKKRQLELAEVQLDDAAIKEMLRPKTALEKDPRGFTVLTMLVKHGPIPGPVMQKILGAGTSGLACEGIMSRLIEETLVDLSRNNFDGHRCNIFTITKKGRDALKGRAALK